jgi:hypothetical protein
MAAVTIYRCEICNTESSSPIHWFVIQCNSEEVKVLKWNADAAAAKGARHYCGEAHASVYVSRWLQDSCTPAPIDPNQHTPVA